MRLEHEGTRGGVRMDKRAGGAKARMRAVAVVVVVVIVVAVVVVAELPGRSVPSITMLHSKYIVDGARQERPALETSHTQARLISDVQARSGEATHQMRRPFSPANTAVRVYNDPCHGRMVSVLSNCSVFLLFLSVVGRNAFISFARPAPARQARIAPPPCTPSFRCRAQASLAHCD